MKETLRRKGFCVCGCGQLTKLAPWTNRHLGWIKGQSIRFVCGHSGSAGLRGSLNANWRGGINLTTDGYLRQRTNRGYQLHHRIRAEQAIGHVLPPWVVVHHPDEDPSNPTARLIVCESQAYHFLLHRRTEAYRATGNPTARKCEICKTWADVMREVGNGNKISHAFHPECRRRWQQAYRRRRRSCMK